jgi:hypothetical protein
MIFDEIRAMLEGLGDGGDGHLPKTELYNEGWLLRLVLSAAARPGADLPIPIRPSEGARWFSEALLATAFSRAPLDEGQTSADGIVGHFRFRPGTWLGLELVEGGSQFVVCEAKMFSPLSPKVTYAPGYDQAARTVACMAKALDQCPGRDTFTCVGFYVLAPLDQIERGVFAQQMTRQSILDKITARIAAYSEAHPERREELERWSTEVVAPLLGRLDLRCTDWETLIRAIYDHDAGWGGELQVFYQRCRDFNGPRIEVEE